ncbi:MAG: hypothetical protein IPM79_10400 [Polyangiaceae bacterium]|nr:hypothetical protein [Polyangiaceae bacterium]MBK8938032.1 hypothetical protein [Polyangiaceae bacterium]
MSSPPPSSCRRTGPSGRAAGLVLFALVAPALAGCAGGGQSAPPPREAGLLDACVVQREADEVTSVRCGELLAVEALVLSATEQEIAAAFDDFAVSFGGAGVPRRVESEYAKGDARYKTMRLEGTDRAGAPLEAQMVAVLVGNGARLVTCSSKAAVAGAPTCGDVISELMITPAARVSRSEGSTFTR